MASQKLARIRITVLVFGLLGAASLHLQGVVGVSLVATAQGQHSIYIDAGCPEGSFCGNLRGFGGGCSSRVCCPSGQTYCMGTARTGFPFPKVVAAAKGTCFAGGANADYCFYALCVGGGEGGLCDDTCQGNEEFDDSTVKRNKPTSTGDMCPGEKE